MVPESPTAPEEEPLVAELRRAIAGAPARPTEIEVGISLSIALGRTRPSVACGGCSTPLEFEGIPARTNAHLRVPFRLLYTPPQPPEAPGS
ncbi:MAG TPA: hypothetical protein VMI55_04880 [Thermoplasmata archaeon]|nr:hypothetical protein [Thermoplasmata archaeon]